MATNPIDLDAALAELSGLETRLDCAEVPLSYRENEDWHWVEDAANDHVASVGEHLSRGDAKALVLARNLVPLLAAERAALKQQLAEAKAACSALYHFMQRSAPPAPGEVDRVIGLAHKVIQEEVERDQEEQRRIRRLAAAGSES